jgi:hypothetical protein
MSRVQRQHARKPVNAAGYLYSTDGWPLGECEMKDVSESGAKLVHNINDDVPARLLLSFSRNGQVRRHCQVMWKKPNEIGVRFLAKS